MGLVIVAGAAIVLSGLFTPHTAQASVPTTQVTRGNLQSTVVSSGQLEPAADVQLNFGAAGTITQIYVRQGQTVQQGAKLAALDSKTLQLAVDQAQAALVSAQAKLDATKAGASPTDIANAQAALVAAQAKLTTVKAGPDKNTVANAQATLTSALSKLHALQAGATKEDIAGAQAALTAAQAKLDALNRPPDPHDVASAQAAVAAAQAKLDALKAPPSPEAVANDQVALTAAQAKLDSLKAGATSADISAAQLQVTTAQTDYDKTASTASLDKQQAQVALFSAADTVRDDQDKLDEAAVINVPHQGTQNIMNPDGSFNTNATMTQIDTYKAALRTEQDAELAMQQAQRAYDSAAKQEIDDDAAAQATLNNAKAQLANVTSGATAADLAAAQAALDQAQNNLKTLQAPPTAPDLAQAQAAVTQAQENLAKLQESPAQTDLVQAQAAVTQAQQNLATLEAPPTADALTQAQATVTQARAALATAEEGPTAADLAAAQTAVDQAQNNLNQLKAGPLATDVEQAQATVTQAQANLEAAQANLANATLVAPFSGVVADLPLNAGAQVSATTEVVELIDPRSYHVDMNVGESDISRVQVGQDVDLTFDALPDAVFTGTLTYVAPKATITSGVVSYLATATLDPKVNASAGIRPGMTATAAAIVASASNVLEVPNRAIKTQGNQKFVIVLVGKDQIPVPVQTGLTDGTNTEITGNTALREGDTIVLNSATTTPASNPADGRGGIFNLGGGGFGGR
jgi:HlyD family secretion protein